MLRCQHLTIVSCLHHLQVEKPYDENAKKKRKYPEKLCVSRDFSFSQSKLIQYFLSYRVFLLEDHLGDLLIFLVYTKTSGQCNKRV